MVRMTFFVARKEKKLVTGVNAKGQVARVIHLLRIASFPLSETNMNNKQQNPLLQATKRNDKKRTMDMELTQLRALL